MRKKCGAPVLPLHSSVTECGGCFCSHPTVVSALGIHGLSKESTRDRWIDRIQCLRHCKWSGESPNKQTVAEWNGSLLDEAHGSEMAPNALEDDGGGVGTRALVLQPHAAVLVPPVVLEFRQVRRAPLRKADFEHFGYTDNCPACANARAGREQAVH